MNSIIRPFLICLLFPLLFVDFAQAWGPTGHRIVGRIAERHLDTTARQEIVALMRHETLPRASTWADEIKSNPSWDHADVWHYMSIDDDESFDTFERNPDGDVLWAIEHFTAVLRDRGIADESRREALRFLVHFVGDIHQPLHVGRRDDRGGNRIDVEWMREPSNLHRVWDSDMINSYRLSFSEYAELIDHPTPEQIRTWQAATVLDWAKESYAMRPEVYAVEDGDLGYKYRYRNLQQVELRMLQAGVRLAGLFNDVFENLEPADSEDPASDEADDADARGDSQR